MLGEILGLLNGGREEALEGGSATSTSLDASRGWMAGRATDALKVCETKRFNSMGDG